MGHWPTYLTVNHSEFENTGILYSIAKSFLKATRLFILYRVIKNCDILVERTIALQVCVYMYDSRSEVSIFDCRNVMRDHLYILPFLRILCTRFLFLLREKTMACHAKPIIYIQWYPYTAFRFHFQVLIKFMYLTITCRCRLSQFTCKHDLLQWALLYMYISRKI